MTTSGTRTGTTTTTGGFGSGRPRTGRRPGPRRWVAAAAAGAAVTAIAVMAGTVSTATGAHAAPTAKVVPSTPSINGESVDRRHTGTIEVLSW
jgi:hypothetical protein